MLTHGPGRVARRNGAGGTPYGVQLALSVLVKVLRRRCEARGYSNDTG
jgi:hypothetical protein